MPQDPLCLLCVEPRFPGRLGPVADWLVRKRGYRCWFYCNSAAPRRWWPPSAGAGLEVVGFEVGGVAREGSVPWTRLLERGLCYAYGAWEVLEARRPRPVDVVLGRSCGLGSTLFVPPFAPRVPIVQLFDYYYHAHSFDLTDDYGPGMPPDYFHWRHAANAVDLLDLENGVAPWAPTAWQRDLYPAEYRDDFLVLHEGADPRRFRRRADRAARRIAGRDVPDGAKVVSFVAPEPDMLRGFDRFVALANRLLPERGDVLCVAAGGGAVRRALDVRHFGRDYAAEVLARSPPADPSRLWSLGPATPEAIVELLSASDLHVYPSRPYPAARSLVEAMAAGCPILAWDAEPVRELLEDGRTARLVPPDDPEVAARAALALLDDPASSSSMGRAAAEVARERFDRDRNLAALAERLDSLAKGGATARP